MTINDSDTDRVILSVAEPSWRKVAMIVSRAAKRIGPSAATDDGYHLVATRVQALVADGRLIAQGDLSNWRHSEVRLP